MWPLFWIGCLHRNHPVTRLRLMDGDARTKPLVLSQFAWTALHIFIQAPNPPVSEHYHTCCWWQVLLPEPILCNARTNILNDQISHDVCVFSTPRTHRRSHLEAMQFNQFRSNLAPNAFSFITRPQLRKREPGEASWLYWGILSKCPNSPQCQVPKNLEKHTS